jgi:hypothetical protein
VPLVKVALRLVGEVAAAALWVVAAFYDLPSVDETTASRASNLHGTSAVRRLCLLPGKSVSEHWVSGTPGCPILGRWPK